MSLPNPNVVAPPIPLKLQGKLAILADAAKYDASCSSSGTQPRNSLDGKGVGSTGGSGICHSYAPDGRCISLLKVLLTNFCTFDCLYCVNRVSSNVPRARFSIDEVVELTLSFYKRNYIEGLFLSSGIIQSPDYTMEQVVEVARKLRVVHDFRGYIHLKTIPEASPDLLGAAGLYADRLSINIELARPSSLATLAPQKNSGGIRRSMAAIRMKRDEASEPSYKGKSAPRFATAGQSTQMIVGADSATDKELLHCSDSLYSSYKLKRVYYSAFSPIPDSSAALPLQPVNLAREHRLYQADWLMRFYEFDVREIVAGGQDGMLDEMLDPKLAWALKHREQFPVDINRAGRERLLRIPGLGTRGVERILACRSSGFLRLADLKKISRSVKRMLPFIIARDWSPATILDSALLREQFVQKHAQQDLFGF
ncbi:MAG: putative DNA modification/repair radical SAM protein [Granulosicoccus sp.]